MSEVETPPPHNSNIPHVLVTSYAHTHTKFINPLAYNIKYANATFAFNEYISQPDRMDFVEAIRKEISSHKDDTQILHTLDPGK